MALRKKKHLTAVLDSYMEPKPPQSVALDPGGFRNIIRLIKTQELDRVRIFLTMCSTRMEEIGLMADEDEAISGVPDGSDQIDMGSLKTWVDRVELEDTRACDQLRKLQATAKSRIES